MRGASVASRTSGDRAKGAPAPSRRCDYRLDIPRARPPYRYTGRGLHIAQARAMWGASVASRTSGDRATSSRHLSRHRQA